MREEREDPWDNLIKNIKIDSILMIKLMNNWNIIFKFSSEKVTLMMMSCRFK